MWAQYGHNHTGICLEIDKLIFEEENQAILKKNSFFEEVIYTMSDSYPFIEHDTLQGHQFKKGVEDFRKRNYQHIFFTKHVDWSSEREVRLLHFTDSQQDIFCTIEKSLKRVIVGIDFNKNLLGSLNKLVRNNIFKIVQEDMSLIAMQFSKEKLESLTQES